MSSRATSRASTSKDRPPVTDTCVGSVGDFITIAAPGLGEPLIFAGTEHFRNLVSIRFAEVETPIGGVFRNEVEDFDFNGIHFFFCVKTIPADAFNMLDLFIGQIRDRVEGVVSHCLVEFLPGGRRDGLDGILLSVNPHEEPFDGDGLPGLDLEGNGGVPAFASVPYLDGGIAVGDVGDGEAALALALKLEASVVGLGVDAGEGRAGAFRHSLEGEGVEGRDGELVEFLLEAVDGGLGDVPGEDVFAVASLFRSLQRERGLPRLFPSWD